VAPCETLHSASVSDSGPQVKAGRDSSFATQRKSRLSPRRGGGHPSTEPDSRQRVSAGARDAQVKPPTLEPLCEQGTKEVAQEHELRLVNSVAFSFADPRRIGRTSISWRQSSSEQAGFFRAEPEPCEVASGEINLMHETKDLRAQIRVDAT
jgi:hypothetical protein